MQRVHVITQGCSANQADSEIMEGLLLERRHVLSGEEEADIVVFNTCTVKGPSESFFRKKLVQLEEEGKKVIIAGCIPQSEKRRGEWARHSMIGTDQIRRIGEAVEETSEGNVVSFLQRKPFTRINLPKTRKNPLVEIVPISQGCLSACSFCKTKLARGNLYSHAPEDIVRHISKAVEEGARDIWLSSQDNSAYGKDIGTDMVELLRKISSIPREFRVRFGMGNPDHMKGILPGIIEAFRHPKLYQFIHIPVQAGSDSVLKAMRRDYTVQEYRDIVARIREELPWMTIATDIICGFPGETGEDFEETLQLIRETRPDAVNISRFWPRSGTLAARMEQLPGDEIKRRTRAVTACFRENAELCNRKWIGWKGEVRIMEEGKGDTMIGRNFAYKQVIVPGKRDLGEVLEVEIEAVTSFDLRAKA